MAEALARMGIGRITLIDFDGIEQINLDRLLHATEADIGKAKVAMLAAALDEALPPSHFPSCRWSTASSRKMDFAPRWTATFSSVAWTDRGRAYAPT